MGDIRAGDVMGQVDENTRMVALASNHFMAQDFRLDLAGHRQNFARPEYFILRGWHPDRSAHFRPRSNMWIFIAADAHKMAARPLCGAGFFYVRKSLQDETP